MDRLTREEIECVIDIRPDPRPGQESDLIALRQSAESAEMYYAHLPDFAKAAYAMDSEKQISRPVAWAARIALRHRVCVVTRGAAWERDAASCLGELVGLRVVDLDAR